MRRRVATGLIALGALVLVGCPSSKTEEQRVDAPSASVARPSQEAPTAATQATASVDAGSPWATAGEGTRDGGATGHPSWCTSNHIKPKSSCVFLKDILERRAQFPICEQENQACRCEPRICITAAGSIPNCDAGDLEWNCKPKPTDGCPAFFEARKPCARESLRCSFENGLCTSTFVCRAGAWASEAPTVCRPAAVSPKR